MVNNIGLLDAGSRGLYKDMVRFMELGVSRGRRYEIYSDNILECILVVMGSNIYIIYI